MKAGKAKIAEALGRLIAEKGGRAYGAASRLCGNDEEARELVQEASYRVLKSWRRYDDGRALEGWFLAVARNAFLDGRRSYARRYGVSLDEPIGDGAAQSYGDVLAEKGGDMLANLESREIEGSLWRALGGLSRAQRALLTQCDVEGRGYAEIARSLGMRVGTVKSGLFRARASLRGRYMTMEAA